jgi:hypothetical protein
MLRITYVPTYVVVTSWKKLIGVRNYIYIVTHETIRSIDNINMYLQESVFVS